jgi:hypothetical protein
MAEWFHGKPRCPPGGDVTPEGMWVAYGVAAGVGVWLLQNGRTLMHDVSSSRTDGTGADVSWMSWKRAGRVGLMVVQAVALYLLYAHCGNCQCWEGLQKVSMLAVVYLVLALKVDPVFPGSG